MGICTKQAWKQSSLGASYWGQLVSVLHYIPSLGVSNESHPFAGAGAGAGAGAEGNYCI